MTLASSPAASRPAASSTVVAEGGQEAMVQRLAEKYVGELAEMAKNSSMVIVPDRPNDLAAVVASAVGMYGKMAAGHKNGGGGGGSGSGSEGTTANASKATSGDWLTTSTRKKK